MRVLLHHYLHLGYGNQEMIPPSAKAYGGSIRRRLQERRYLSSYYKPQRGATLNVFGVFFTTNENSDTICLVTTPTILIAVK